MPVEGNTQPYGLLHGGASAVLAETLGSVGSMLHGGSSKIAVGVDLNCTHHRGVRSGLVTGVATPLHRGRSTATYEIVVSDEAGQAGVHGPADLSAAGRPDGRRRARADVGLIGLIGLTRTDLGRARAKAASPLAPRRGQALASGHGNGTRPLAGGRAGLGLALLTGVLVTGCTGSGTTGGSTCCSTTGASAATGGSTAARGGGSPSPSATPPEELCAKLVAHWSRETLDGDTYGDYQSMGLSNGQYDILREVVDAARAEKKRAGSAAAERLIDRRARTRLPGVVPLGRSRREALAVSGVGPVEPGEGTRAWDAPEPDTPPRPEPPHGRFTQAYARHRRAVLAGAAAVVALTGGGYLYATRPEPAPPPEPTPRETPYPSQAVDVSYLGPAPRSAGAPRERFGFELELSVLYGPPITVEGMTQPYAGLSLRTDPLTPFRIGTKETRKIAVTMRVTECGKVPKNAGLPFLDVTLRNTRAIEAHSFILGERYAQDLSDALQVACSNESMSSPKP